MELTNAQLDTLETWLTANASGQNDEQAKDLLNATAAPSNNIAWKTNVSIREVGDKLNGAELAGLTSLNHTRLQTVCILSTAGVNPSLADRRQFFDDIFSGAGGATTRASLLALWKTLATRVQKLFAAGTGSDASPATLAANVGQSFQLTAQEVETARNLP
jgi:hypothetical protein